MKRKNEEEKDTGIIQENMENQKKKVSEWKFFEEIFGFREDKESVMNFISAEEGSNIEMTSYANDRYAIIMT